VFSDFPGTAVTSRFLFELERECDEHGPKRHRMECLDCASPRCTRTRATYLHSDFPLQALQRQT